MAFARDAHTPRIAADFAILDPRARHVELDIDLALLTTVRTAHDELVIHGPHGRSSARCTLTPLPEGPLPSRHDMNTIGSTVHIVGEVHSDEDLLVEGHIEGTIHMGEAALTIGPPATVHADVRGRAIHIRGGHVRGTISAAERIEIAASASVNGYLTANHVIIVDGATFNGRIDMGRRAIAAQVARYKAAHDRKRP